MARISLPMATVDTTFNAWWKHYGSKPETVQQALEKTKQQLGPPMPPGYVPPPLRPTGGSLKAGSTTTGAITTVLQRVHNLIPRGIARQKSAVAMLGWAKIAIDFPAANDFNKAALQLVNRCFKILVNPSQKSRMKGDIDTISQVYLAGLTFLQDPNIKSYFIEVTDDEMKRQCEGLSGGAFTYAGHWANRTPADGIFINKDVCASHTDDWLLDAITHEFAHFCGPLPPNDVRDQGYGDTALTLPREKCLKNAANHAWFAGLSQTAPTNWPSGSYPS